MGRTRKSARVSSGKIGKKEKLDRKIQEEKLKIDRLDLKAPDFLDDVGKTEFERVVRETAKVDILDNLDLSILAIYCNSYSQYIQISKQIMETGPDERFIKEKRVSPLINAQDKIINQIMRCSTKLGLATTDRLKLIVPSDDDKKENKFIKYMI